ncbi:MULTISPECIES: SEL1-like repeat protein [Campylobacter]|uniref:SEL1-like repeat protein n=1 Tax=Campylobacter TaxID=194 RepID=UPI000A34912B|nr:MULTISPECIES: SEL1-like repeat protein [unclassified Campylobacter]MCR8696574.1 SEL1-like repeat protein [Campylobacter sp. RM19073]
MRSAVVAILAGFILAGCLQKFPAPITTKPDQIEVTQDEIEAKINIFYNDCTNLKEPSKCKRLADGIYKSGDFKSAAIAYDMICYGFQYIPACKQLADMFVYGDGVTKDIDTAITIYQIACNNGDNNSCDLAKNLRAQNGKK